MVSVYLHIPFCQRRCSYCDFNTYSGLGNLIPDYVKALCGEIQFLSGSSPDRIPVHTIYFGGGTPSLLSIDQVEQILNTLDSCFQLQPDLEVSLEANPGTLSPGQLIDLHKLGFNRLSLGMQSANPLELTLLQRIHDPFEVIQSVKWAREAGFTNLNLDLIFGLPGQALESWKRSVNLALGMEPEHFSLYSLTLEKGTDLESWVRRGLVPEPDVDLAADMYEWAAEILTRYNYAHYEISNWGRLRKVISSRLFSTEDTFACRHNLQYWRNLPYLGFGAGAHGYIENFRTANVCSPLDYIRRLSGVSHNISNSCKSQAATHGQSSPLDRFGSGFPITPATQDTLAIDRTNEMAETMMMGLRLTEEGVSRESFHQRFGDTITEVYGAQIERLIGMGLLEWGGNNQEVLRLTDKGHLLGNRVFVEFL